MEKGRISLLLRRFGRIDLLDRLRHPFLRLQNWMGNRAFKRACPDLALPPGDLLYASCGMGYERYYRGGRQTADWVAERIIRYQKKTAVRVLDWGCGPGRVARHLPGLLGMRAEVCATDANPEAIAWCREHIQQVSFETNELQPGLSYPDGHFDFVFGISVLSNLDPDLQAGWVAELRRVLKPGGILLLTTQGDAFLPKLSDSEREVYEAGELVLRGDAGDGRRDFSVFHPPAFANRLFGSLRLVEHVPGTGPSAQDVWVLEA